MAKIDIVRDLRVYAKTAELSYDAQQMLIKAADCIEELATSQASSLSLISVMTETFLDTKSLTWQLLRDAQAKHEREQDET